jgi:RNA polymerase sigma-70 factor, ECF subfamily
MRPVPWAPDSDASEDLLQDVAVLVGLTDEELVARSIGGDTDCFNQLIKRWERPIYALAYRTLGREEDARDICQETFLRAFRALDGFKGQAKFSSWLYRIALNLCRDWLRRERRAPVVATPDGVDLVELAGEGEGVERLDESVARRDLSRAVARAMRSLPEDQRTAIVLKEYHGLTFQEISELLGCPLSTVKTRLYQGLTVLRRELEANGIGTASGLGVAGQAKKPGQAARAI